MSLKENRVKKALKEGRVCVGAMVSSYRSPQIAQILGACGWDYFIMDTEWAKEWIGKGMRFLTYYTDIRFLMDGAKNATPQLREIPSPKK